MGSERSFDFREPVLLGCALLITSCASDPMKRPEVVQLSKEEPLPRTIRMKVVCDEKSLFGGEEDWIRDISRIFEELNVCTKVWREGDEKAKDADMAVQIILEAKEPFQQTEIDGQGALLDTLAWSTLPFVPWFIHDVQVDPGLQMRIQGESLPSQIPMTSEGELVVECPSIKSSLKDRRTFFSWQTLGCLVVPPFLFRGSDGEHLAGSISEEVRLEVAFSAAKVVKNSWLQGKEELLRDLKIGRSGEDWFLSGVPSQNLLKLTLRIQPADPGTALSHQKTIEEFVKFGAKTTDPTQWNLEKLNPDLFEKGALLRIDALGRDDRRLRYTVPLPAGPSSSSSGG